MTIHKPKYIRKYDYIHYFTRPRDQWFWKESDLEDYINHKIKQLDKVIDVSDEDQNDEFDSLEKLRQLKAEGSNIDLTNPKVHEGNIIDKEARKFIKMKFHLDVYDFDELYPNNYDFDFLFNETKKFLQKDNYILYQPVFIYKNKAIAKPDAFIKKNGKYTLIEVKGTSKPKISHFVDIIYQQHVINHVLGLCDEHLDDYLLCVVKYVRGEKNKMDLAFTTHIPLNIGGRDLGGLDNLPMVERYSDVTIAKRCQERLGDDSEATIKQLLQQDETNIKKRKLSVYRDDILPLLDENHFLKIIDELWAYAPCEEPGLMPDSEHFITWFNKYSQLALIRKYYFNNPAYPSMQWSGNVLKLKMQLQAYMSGCDKNNTLREYIMEMTKKPEIARFFEGFQNSLYTNFNLGVYRTKETKEYFQKLKARKVYFDFETINSAVRIMDDTVPYTQNVTQASIIKNDGTSNNIVFDPLRLDKQCLKKIIDAIFSGVECSYVVYNKSFECARLREMAAYLHDQTYIDKVNVINNNVFDLADFFDPRKDLITIANLHGYYSIKNVLPIVKEHANDLFLYAGCKDYKSLEGVQNGGEALNQTSRRFFNLINDKQWNDIVGQLKIYCENDVRAMIAIEYWIKRILK